MTPKQEEDEKNCIWFELYRCALNGMCCKLGTKEFYDEDAIVEEAATIADAALDVAVKRLLPSPPVEDLR